jgi:Divergent InlB B-repeat domain
MTAIGQQQGTRFSHRTVRTTAALAIVGFLLLLPAAVVCFNVVDSSHESPLGARSGPNAAWGQKENGTIRFVETGLAAGTTWTVDLSGTHRSSNGTTISFSEGAGTYPYSVTHVTGYKAHPTAGNVTLSQCSLGVTVQITFTPLTVTPGYTVTFEETGLVNGTSWWVDFDGNNTSSVAPTISFPAANDTYAFTDASVLSGGPGVQFETSVDNGTVVVNGTNVTVVIPYSTQYYLTTVPSPASGGTVAPPSGWFAAGAEVNLSAVPNSGFAFVNWSGSGNGSYSGTNATPVISMNGPITETATFGVGYSVDFEEHGLPDGAVWSVTFNNVTESGILDFLNFSVANGNYTYELAPISGFHADTYRGTVTVAGHDVTVQVNWTMVTYTVTFEETGLPSGTSWSVALNGTSESSTSSSIQFVVTNGTLPFTVTPVTGYTANVTGGTVPVHGANRTVLILWTSTSSPTSATYSITFVEAGLPVGTNWSVTLTGTGSSRLSSTATSLVFTGLPDGTYSYAVPAVGNYAPTPSADFVTVSGANVTVHVNFVAPTTPAHSSTSMSISILDLIIIALIIGAGVTVTYLIYRRS